MIKGRDKEFPVAGICAAGIQMENVTELVVSTVKNLSALGIKSLIFSSFTDMLKKDDFAVGEASIYSLIDNDLLDAVIVLPESIKDDAITDSIIKKAAGRGIPVISVDRQIEGCVSVVFNYADSFEEVIRHVITVHGCKKINFIAGMKGNRFSDERVERYKKELAEHGLEFDEERFGYGDFWAEPTEALAESWFEKGFDPPEAVICANDAMALAACRVFKKHGLKVPGDVIVTGFDGIELERYHTPRLTTCAVDINEAGRAAAEAAQRLMKGEFCPPVLEIQYRMRISQSCGCRPVDMSIVADKVMELNTEMTGDDYHETYMYNYLMRGLECTKPSKLVEVIHQFCLTQTWICLGVDYLSEKRSKRRIGGEFSKQMKLMMYTDEPSQRGTVFETDTLLPKLSEAFSKSDTLMFCPLHYGTELIGYTAFAVDIDRLDFRRTRRFVMLTDQILESMRNRLTIQRANEKLAEMHVHDPMTGVFNRRGFYTNASKLIKRLSKKGGSAVIFSVDMDNLKGINDEFGHNEGDKAIKALAAALTKCSCKGDICSRFGGDEFIVLSANPNGVCIAEFSERVQAALAEHTKHARSRYEIIVSIGSITARIASVDDLDECIRLADEKMYSEKRSHKRSARR